MNDPRTSRDPFHSFVHHFLSQEPLYRVALDIFKFPLKLPPLPAKKIKIEEYFGVQRAKSKPNSTNPLFLSNKVTSPRGDS